jgi:hypothetical protein
MNPHTPKTYTPEDKAAALATLTACGGNISQASRTLGIPRKTLQQWRKGRDVAGLTADMQSFANMELSDKLDAVAHKLADAIPGKIEKAPLNHITTSLGIAIDKRNLLKGQPTSITERRSEKDHYETAVAQLIAECKRNGLEIDREEAIDLLEPHQPAIKKHLH